MNKYPSIERITTKIGLSAAAASLVLTGCVAGGESDQSGTTTGGSGYEASTGGSGGSSIDQQLQQSLNQLKGYVDQSRCKAVIQQDLDCDGVLNAEDQLAGRNDFGDDDKDLVVNVFDKYPNYDDKRMDADRDGLWDSFDEYNGNNFLDDDQDGIPNGHDLQPQLPAPATGNAPSSQDRRVQAGNAIIKSRMANQFFGEILDVNIWPQDTGYNPLTTDSDGDKFNDYFDPLPRNPYIDQKNDIYTVGSDAWYEKNAQDRALDPYS